jgi:hypothetical protein
VLFLSFLLVCRMAKFPPDWQLYDDQEFLGFSVEPEPDVGPGTALCLQVRSDGRAVGHFRIVNFGSSLLTAEFEASLLLQFPAAFGMKLVLKC